MCVCAYACVCVYSPLQMQTPTHRLSCFRPPAPLGCMTWPRSIWGQNANTLIWLARKHRKLQQLLKWVWDTLGIKQIPHFGSVAVLQSMASFDNEGCQICSHTSPSVQAAGFICNNNCSICPYQWKWNFNEVWLKSVSWVNENVSPLPSLFLSFSSLHLCFLVSMVAPGHCMPLEPACSRARRCRPSIQRQPRQNHYLLWNKEGSKWTYHECFH